MKKVFVLCTILAVMSCLAWAGEISNTPSNVVTKDNPVVQNDAQKLAKTPQEAPYYHSPRNLLDDCTTPFPEGFEGASVPDVPACWMVVDQNSDGFTWKTKNSTTYSHGGTNSVYYGYNSASAANDWLITPGVTLNAGTLYSLKFWERVRSSYPEKLEILMGTAQDTAYMMTTVQPAMTYTNNAYAQVTNTISVTVTGTYYIAFHCISLADEYDLYLDDITLTEVPSTGRCCYPDPAQAHHFLCADNLAADCAALSGTWTAGTTCTAEPCVQPLQGANCSWPLEITSLPYTNTNTTLGYGDDYNSTTCLGDYDNGPDVVYQFTISARTCITVDLTSILPSTYHYAGVAIFDGCPETDSCIAQDFATSTDLHIACTDLQPGTYFIMVDNYAPGPDYLTAYTLTVNSCACPQSCETYTLCGTPAEVEPNNVCYDAGIAAQPVLTCDGTVYGLICPVTDADLWAVSVPPFTKMTLTPYDGEGCLTTPATCIQTRPYDTLCTALGSGAASGAWTLTNSGEYPWDILFKVTGVCVGTYKLTAVCCPLVNPCDLVIEIPATMSYNTTVSTCPTDPCGLLANPLGVWADSCAGDPYTSGPSKIFKIRTYNTGNLTIDAVGATSQDVQVMVFTDCANAMGTCVGSSDNLGGSSTPEEIVLTNLHEGTYYVSISFYGANNCGEMSLSITGDVVLPVELSGEPTATAGNGSVTLDWATASETNNSRFEIARNGETVASIPTQGNGASGHSYTYTDNGLTNGTLYHYTLRTVSVDNVVSTVATLNATPGTAGNVTEYSLHQNYPNPFNPTTSIVFDMVDAGSVSLKVYNLMGQEVANLVNGPMTAGHHLVSFDAKNLPSGLYMYRLNVNGFNAEKKMLLMK